MIISLEARSLVSSIAGCLLLCACQGSAQPTAPEAIKILQAPISAPSRTWDRQVTLVPSDGIAQEQFGTVVAIDGDTALVGAPGDNNALHVADNTGSAYVWHRSGGKWQPQQKLESPDPTPGQQFGSAIAVRGDVAVVGAFGDNTRGEYSGDAYVFVRTGSTWAATPQKLLGDEEMAPDELFGWSVAVDGDEILIGAPGNGHKGDGAGAAYLFHKHGSSWGLANKLFASDPLTGAQFGWSVALSNTVAVVGAIDADATGGADAGTAPPDTGAAYVFSGDFSGQATKLLSSDHASGDLFGISVSVNGSTIAVGASTASGGLGASAPVQAGAVYVFNGSGINWTEQQKLFKPTAESGDSFGSAVALSADALFATSPADANGGSSVFAFTRTQQNWSSGVQIAAPSDLDVNDRFAGSLALSGETAIIGAQNTATVGSATVFALTDGSPCSLPADCVLGNCTEGVCCHSACDGICLSCLAARKASGTGDGTCGPVLAATDPRDSCATQAASTCGTTGVCDGNGACQTYPVGTECSPAICLPPQTARSSACDVAGQCKPTDTDCGSYPCAGGHCSTACAANTDCTSGSFCNSASTCEQDRPLTCNADNTAAIGTDGTTLTPCQNFRCVDGACLTKCSTADECADGMTCDPVTQLCAAPCTSIRDCAKGLACDSMNHVCTALCSSSKDCGDGNNCGPVSRQCTSKADCLVSSDCGGDLVCDSNSKQCATTCDAPSDCRDGLACESGNHVCTAHCSSGQECAGGFNCSPTDQQCTKKAACIQTSDCAKGFVCDSANKQCAKACHAASDCGDGLACDLQKNECATTCSSAKECAAGLNCGPVSRQCTAETACSVLGDCTDGLACDRASHTCATRCSAAMDCANGFACDPVSHACSSVCSSAGDCGDGLNCSPSMHQCTNDPACSSSNDCPIGFACNPTKHQCMVDEAPSSASSGCSLGSASTSARQRSAALELVALLGLLTLRRRKSTRLVGRDRFLTVSSGTTKRV